MGDGSTATTYIGCDKGTKSMAEDNKGINYTRLALGAGLLNIFIALGLTSWVTICRLTRGQFLSLREKEFVVAARSVGAPARRIILHHLLPNALTPMPASAAHLR